MGAAVVIVSRVGVVLAIDCSKGGSITGAQRRSPTLSLPSSSTQTHTASACPQDVHVPVVDRCDSGAKEMTKEEKDACTCRNQKFSCR